MSDIRRATTADADAIARVQVDTWRATYQSLLPAAYLARMRYDRHARMWLKILAAEKNEPVFVASRAGVIAGFAAGGPNRSPSPPHTGEIYALYVQKDCQGLGLGRDLFTALRETLAELGHESLCLWVLDGNPAAGFYEHIGGELISLRFEDFAGTRLKELGYGWG